MTVGQALARGRRAKAKVLQDRGGFSRPGDPALDPDTNIETDSFTPGYSGPCRIKAYRIGKPAEAGESLLELQRYDVEIPWDATPPAQRNDIFTATQSDDAWVIGRPLTVIDISYGGTTTSRHIIVEDRA